MNLIGRDKVVNPSNAQYEDGTRVPAQFAEGKTGMFIYQNNAENNLKANGMKPDAYGVAEVPVGRRLAATRSCPTSPGSTCRSSPTPSNKDGGDGVREVHDRPTPSRSS